MDTKDKWLYDIYLDYVIVGNQGDEAFDTEEEAVDDADDYIKNELTKLYNRPENDFYIECYQAQY